VRRDRAPPQMLDDRGFERERCMVPGNRDDPDLGRRRERHGILVCAVTHDRHASSCERVARKGRDVPARRQHDRASVIEHARVGFRDHLEAFHDAPLCYSSVRKPLKTCRR
jgi:hypothetical protein